MMTTLTIAWRGLWRNKRRTIISVCAISFGLALAVFFLSFAEGVYRQMVSDACRMQAGHLTLEHTDYRDAPAVDLVVRGAPALREVLNDIPGVIGTKALVLGQGVARSGTGAAGVAIIGVEPAIEARTSPLASHIVKGSYLEVGDGNKVVLGKKLAERLKLDLGKKLVISSNDVGGDLVEELLRVKGIFSSGAAEIDGYVIQVPIDFSRRLFGMAAGDVTQLGAMVADPSIRDAVRAEVASRLLSSHRADIATLPWETVMPELASYVRLDRGSNQIFQAIIIFLSLFTIFNTIVMSVLERTREFAVMLALGTPSATIRGMLLAESALLGLLGVVAGLSLGGVAGMLGEIRGIDLSSFVEGELSVSGFAMDPRMHAYVSWEILVTLGATVFLATVAVGFVASRRLRRIDVADVLRYRG